MGHGAGYVYPHGNEEGWVDQQYLPDEITNERYYSPTQHGHEAELSDYDRGGEWLTGRGETDEKGFRRPRQQQMTVWDLVAVVSQSV
ncbi:MAG: hypothetical protein Ct9H300mP26_3570 [Acidimicrobiales bacterium]|nr:MAG: hypothetical protein Ct9H300mP26_3570 [Acidimicrobiales bacterium]